MNQAEEKTVTQLASYRLKTDAQLLYIARDAKEAAEAMRGVCQRAEAKYLDQVNDACTVMHERKLAATKRAKTTNH